MLLEACGESLHGLNQKDLKNKVGASYLSPIV